MTIKWFQVCEELSIVKRNELAHQLNTTKNEDIINNLEKQEKNIEFFKTHIHNAKLYKEWFNKPLNPIDLNIKTKASIARLNQEIQDEENDTIALFANIPVDKTADQICFSSEEKIATLKNQKLLEIKNMINLTDTT